RLTIRSSRTCLRSSTPILALPKNGAGNWLRKRCIDAQEKSLHILIQTLPSLRRSSVISERVLAFPSDWSGRLRICEVPAEPCSLNQNLQRTIEGRSKTIC